MVCFLSWLLFGSIFGAATTAAPGYSCFLFLVSLSCCRRVVLALSSARHLQSPVVTPETNFNSSARPGDES